MTLQNIIDVQGGIDNGQVTAKPLPFSMGDKIELFLFAAPYIWLLDTNS